MPDEHALHLMQKCQQTDSAQAQCVESCVLVRLVYILGKGQITSTSMHVALGSPCALQSSENVPLSLNYNTRGKLQTEWLQYYHLSILN